MVKELIAAKRLEIEQIEKVLDEYDTDWPNRNPIYRLEREIELLELG